MTKADKTAQILGELVLYIPLLIFSIPLGIIQPCIVSMLFLFIFKQNYTATFHFEEKWYHCMTFSYGIFIAIGLFYNGLKYQFWFMKNQPMLVILIVAGISLINANVGEWQANYKNIEQKLIKPFDCKTATETEIKNKARKCKLTDEQASWIVDKFIIGKTYKQLSRQDESEKACQMRIKRIVKKLNAPAL